MISFAWTLSSEGHGQSSKGPDRLDDLESYLPLKCPLLSRTRAKWWYRGPVSYKLTVPTWTLKERLGLRLHECSPVGTLCELHVSFLTLRQPREKDKTGKRSLDNLS